MMGSISSVLVISKEILALSLGDISLFSLLTRMNTVLGCCSLIDLTYGSMLGSTSTIVNLSFFSLMLLFRFMEWLYYWSKTLYFFFNSSTFYARPLSTNSTITPPSSLCFIHSLFPASLPPSIFMFECKFSLSESCCCNSRSSSFSRRF